MCKRLAVFGVTKFAYVFSSANGCFTARAGNALLYHGFTASVDLVVLAVAFGYVFDKLARMIFGVFIAVRLIAGVANSFFQASCLSARTNFAVRSNGFAAFVNLFVRSVSCGNESEFRTCVIGRI